MKSSSKTPQIDTTFPQFQVFNFDTLVEMQRPFLSAMVDFNTKLVEGVTSFNEEWVGFVNKRLSEDLAVSKQLGSCKTAQEVYDVYSAFCQTAVQQYQGEADKISEIGKSIADDTLHSVQGQFDEIDKRARAA